MAYRQAELEAFGPTKRKARRFWQGAFPELLEFRLASADIEALGVFNRNIAPYAFVRIERASTEGAYQRLDRLAHFIIGKERWNTGIQPSNRGGYYGFIWPSGDVKAPPIGVFTFSIGTEDESELAKSRKASSKQIVVVGFDFKLAFIQPAYQKRGFGYYIAGAVTHWLHNCRVCPPRCAEAGVPVYYYAEYFSRGGERISNLVVEAFRLLEERFAWDEKGLPWHIESFQEETGY